MAGVAVGTAVTVFTWIGNAASVVGLATAPIFLATNAISIKGMMADPQHTVGVRLWYGRGEVNEHLGGPLLSVALWNAVGEDIGLNKTDEHHVNPGDWVDVTIKTPGTTERPEYAALAHGDDNAICLAGVAFEFQDSYDKGMIVGDVIAAKGDVPWYQSFGKIGDADHPPKCVWIQGKPPASNDVKIDGTQNRAALVPAGFSMKISDFVGTVVNDEVAEQRSEEPRYAYGHQARFKLHYDLSGSFSIPIFRDMPLKKLVNERDYPDFFDLAWRVSAPLKGLLVDKRSIAEEDRHAARTAEWDLILDGTLVKGEQSGEQLCASPTSLGPDWYSYEKHHLCHMATKTLIPGCELNVTDACFDAEKHEIRPAVSGPRRRSKRSPEVPAKLYRRYEDARNATTRQYF